MRGGGKSLLLLPGGGGGGASCAAAARAGVSRRRVVSQMPRMAIPRNVGGKYLLADYCWFVLPV
jgi:hypothetical protein